MKTDPALTNGDSKPFWEGAAAHRLLVQRCGACGSVQFPPRHICAACWEGESAWIESAGTGTVESFTIVRRAPMPDFRCDVPYVIAAIRVDEGFRMITNLVGDGRLDVAIGDRVRVVFTESKGGGTLPRFRRAEV